MLIIIIILSSNLKIKSEFIFVLVENLEDCKKLYNLENRGADKMNQNISYYYCERRVVKWWKKLFFAGIEFACFNAKIIFEKKHNKKYNDQC